MFKAGRKILVYPESTFPREKIFPSQKGQPINFSKTPPSSWFFFSFPWWEKIGGKNKFYPWGARLRRSLILGNAAHSSGIISPTLSFHYSLGLAGCTFYIVFFASGYNCSYKLSLTCMNEWKKRGPYYLHAFADDSFERECVYLCVVVVVLWTLWTTLSLSHSLSSLSLPTKPN